MSHFLVFGSHPLLSLAEAKALAPDVRPSLLENLATFETSVPAPSCFEQRLAGSVKGGDIVLDLPIKELTAERLANIILDLPRQPRILFGLTVFGGSPAAKQRTQRLGLQLKRALQAAGRSVRWVTGEAGSLTPAAVSKLHLIDEGYDLVIGLAGPRACVGLTRWVQNADAWSERDYGRPFRDAKTGMLPPKLARMMVNLGTGQRPSDQTTLLDPFCGSGTVLMEAALMGQKNLLGSDIDSQQVQGCQRNFDWLNQRHILSTDWHQTTRLLTVAVEKVADQFERNSIDVVVTEGHLGRPMNGQESLFDLKKQQRDIQQLWRDALANLRQIQRPRGRLVCVWPVFVSSHGTVAVDLKSEIEALGYRLVDPLAGWRDHQATLTYAREDQRVKRNILVLEKL